MWRATDRRFPNDDAWIEKKFGTTPEGVRDGFRPLIKEFFRSDGNWIWHKRIEEEHLRVSKTSKRQSASAKARWNKRKLLSHGNAGSAKQLEPKLELDKKESFLEESVDSLSKSDSHIEVLQPNEPTAQANGGGTVRFNPAMLTLGIGKAFPKDEDFHSEKSEVEKHNGRPFIAKGSSWKLKQNGTFERTKRERI
jgi:uncharacterized protein YdaU (DUF1376 family)